MANLDSNSKPYFESFFDAEKDLEDNVIEAAKSVGGTVSFPMELLNINTDNLDSARKAREPWGRMTIMYGASGRLEIGPSFTMRSVGEMVLQIFVAEHSGVGHHRMNNMNSLRKIVSGFADYLWPRYYKRRGDNEGLTMDTPSFKIIGYDGNGWYQGNLVMPFYIDKFVKYSP